MFVLTSSFYIQVGDDEWELLIVNVLGVSDSIYKLKQTQPALTDWTGIAGFNAEKEYREGSKLTRYSIKKVQVF